MPQVQIEALLLRTVELPDTKPETLKSAAAQLCLDHALDDCQFVARWTPEGKKRRKEQIIL